jgi:hypothetical protein
MSEKVKTILDLLGSSNVYEAMVKLIFDLGLPFDGDVRVCALGKDVELLARAVALVERYNEFRGREVSEILLRLHEEGLIMELFFGREVSPVVYVKPPYWTHQASNYSGGERRRYTVRERRRMLKRIRDELAKAKPDEPFNSLLMRFSINTHASTRLEYDFFQFSPHEIHNRWASTPPPKHLGFQFSPHEIHSSIATSVAKSMR